MSEFMDLEYLLRSEAETRERTRRELAGIFKNVPNAIYVLFKLPHLFGILEPVGTPRQEAQAYCQINYHGDPYSLWCAYDLYERGHYIEAQVVLRHVFESFLKMLFFEKHPNVLKDKLKKKEGDRVNFKAVLEELSPGSSKGFYEKFYGLISTFSHGGVTKIIFKWPGAKPIHGTEFELNNAGFISNQIVHLIFGYMNHYPRIFPKNELSKHSDIEKNFETSKDWLILCMESQKKTFPESRDWYKYLDKLIY